MSDVNSVLKCKIWSYCEKLNWQIEVYEESYTSVKWSLFVFFQKSLPQLL